uniref:Microtubule-associated protein 1A n=1 Tax=Eptatretus burgeri TaxID=7764 RepID=A0A8C4RDM6_EPTBU
MTSTISAGFRGAKLDPAVAPWAKTHDEPILGAPARLLAVLGDPGCVDQLRTSAADIERGVRSWQSGPCADSLEASLREFIARHSARFASGAGGQKTLEHHSSDLETVALLNPSSEAVHEEVRALLSSPAPQKLLLLVGPYLEGSGALALSKGTFSCQDLQNLINECQPCKSGSCLTLVCPDEGGWTSSGLLPPFVSMNPEPVSHSMEAACEFGDYLAESASVPSPFDLLEPPSSGGFLKISRPCCYIFPAGRGDAAIFAVPGFSLLVDGGSERCACFWKLARHLDRLDAILVSHVGADNLPGINGLLKRKVAEAKASERSAQDDEENSSGGSSSGGGERASREDWLRHFISPDLGVVFYNIPERLRDSGPGPVRAKRSFTEGRLTLQLLDDLNIIPRPLTRLPSATSPESLTLFQKLGVGRLDLYTLSPVKDSKEMQFLMNRWAGNSKAKTGVVLPGGKEGDISVPYLTSVAVLLVWIPANAEEKTVRVLFPGNAPQGRILEGLDKLKHLEFLRRPTDKDISKQSKLDNRENLSKTPPEANVKKTSPDIREIALNVEGLGEAAPDMISNGDITPATVKSEIGSPVQKQRDADMKLLKKKMEASLLDSSPKTETSLVEEKHKPQLINKGLREKAESRISKSKERQRKEGSKETEKEIKPIGKKDIRRDFKKVSKKREIADTKKNDVKATALQKMEKAKANRKEADNKHLKKVRAPSPKPKAKGRPERKRDSKASKKTEEAGKPSKGLPSLVMEPPQMTPPEDLTCDFKELKDEKMEDVEMAQEAIEVDELVPEEKEVAVIAPEHEYLNKDAQVGQPIDAEDLEAIGKDILKSKDRAESNEANKDFSYVELSTDEVHEEKHFPRVEVKSEQLKTEHVLTGGNEAMDNIVYTDNNANMEFVEATKSDEVQDDKKPEFLFKDEVKQVGATEVSEIPSDKIEEEEIKEKHEKEEKEGHKAEVDVILKQRAVKAPLVSSEEDICEEIMTGLGAAMASPGISSDPTPLSEIQTSRDVLSDESNLPEDPGTPDAEVTLHAEESPTPPLEVSTGIYSGVTLSEPLQSSHHPLSPPIVSSMLSVQEEDSVKPHVGSDLITNAAGVGDIFDGEKEHEVAAIDHTEGEESYDAKEFASRYICSDEKLLNISSIPTGEETAVEEATHDVKISPSKKTPELFSKVKKDETDKVLTSDEAHGEETQSKDEEASPLNLKGIVEKEISLPDENSSLAKKVTFDKNIARPPSALEEHSTRGFTRDEVKTTLSELTFSDKSITPLEDRTMGLESYPSEESFSEPSNLEEGSHIKKEREVMLQDEDHSPEKPIVSSIEMSEKSPGYILFSPPIIATEDSVVPKVQQPGEITIPPVARTESSYESPLSETSVSLSMTSESLMDTDKKMSPSSDVNLQSAAGIAIQQPRSPDASDEASIPTSPDKIVKEIPASSDRLITEPSATDELYASLSLAATTDVGICSLNKRANGEEDVGFASQPKDTSVGKIMDSHDMLLAKSQTCEAIPSETPFAEQKQEAMHESSESLDGSPAKRPAHLLVVESPTKDESDMGTKLVSIELSPTLGTPSSLPSPCSDHIEMDSSITAAQEKLSSSSTLIKNQLDMPICGSIAIQDKAALETVASIEKGYTTSPEQRAIESQSMPAVSETLLNEEAISSKTESDSVVVPSNGKGISKDEIKSPSVSSSASESLLLKKSEDKSLDIHPEPNQLFTLEPKSVQENSKGIDSTSGVSSDMRTSASSPMSEALSPTYLEETATHEKDDKVMNLDADIKNTMLSMASIAAPVSPIGTAHDEEIMPCEKMDTVSKVHVNGQPTVNTEDITKCSKSDNNVTKPLTFHSSPVEMTPTGNTMLETFVTTTEESVVKQSEIVIPPKPTDIPLGMSEDQSASEISRGTSSSTISPLSEALSIDRSEKDIVHDSQTPSQLNISCASALEPREKYISPQKEVHEDLKSEQLTPEMSSLTSPSAVSPLSDAMCEPAWQERISETNSPVKEPMNFPKGPALKSPASPSDKSSFENIPSDSMVKDSGVKLASSQAAENLAFKASLSTSTENVSVELPQVPNIEHSAPKESFSPLPQNTTEVTILGGPPDVSLDLKSPVSRVAEGSTEVKEKASDVQISDFLLDSPILKSPARPLEEDSSTTTSPVHLGLESPCKMLPVCQFTESVCKQAPDSLRFESPIVKIPVDVLETSPTTRSPVRPTAKSTSLNSPLSQSELTPEIEAFGAMEFSPEKTAVKVSPESQASKPPEGSGFDSMVSEFSPIGTSVVPMPTLLQSKDEPIMEKKLISVESLKAQTSEKLDDIHSTSKLKDSDIFESKMFPSERTPESPPSTSPTAKCPAPEAEYVKQDLMKTDKIVSPNAEQKEQSKSLAKSPIEDVECGAEIKSEKLFGTALDEAKMPLKPP